MHGCAHEYVDICHCNLISYVCIAMFGVSNNFLCLHMLVVLVVIFDKCVLLPCALRGGHGTWCARGVTYQF